MTWLRQNWVAIALLVALLAGWVVGGWLDGVTM